MKAGARLLAGIFLVSFAALLLEISLIRVLSLVHSYSFAILVVSISLFGMAAGGSFVYVKKLTRPYYQASILFSVSCILGYIAFSATHFDPVRASYNLLYAYPLPLYYLLFSLPFFCFGLILAHAFSMHRKEAGKLYFSNLVGSAFGSISALLLIALLGEHAIAAAAAAALIAAAVFSETRLQKAVLVILLILPLIPIPVSISPYKEFSLAMNVPGSEHLESRWNSFSRVDLVNSSFTRYAPGLSLAFDRSLPQQLGILTDGSGMTALSKKDEHYFTDFLPSSVAYRLVERPQVLLINPKAGPDIAAAIRNNATLTVIEYNPLVAEIAGDYRDFSGEIYPKLASEHGRKHVRKNSYDIIIISLSGNVHGSAVYGISQDYDLTVEGISEYYSALNPGGYLIVTRWLSYPPKETLRLYSLASAAADEQNIALFRSWSTVTLVLGKSLDPQPILDFAHKNRFDIIALPAEFTPNVYSVFHEPIYHDYVRLLKTEPGFAGDYLFDISAVTDDRPFYYNFFKLSTMKDLHAIMGESWQPFNDPGFLLLLLLFQAAVLCFAFVMAPLRLLPRSRIMFFFCIGMGYMLVEISLMQNFVMLLGNITHSAAFVITVMLVSSGIGSLVSHRYSISTVFLAIIPGILLMFLFVGRIISLLMGLDSAVSIAASAAILAPLAFFMGMPFPTGIRKTKEREVPWAFAVNGSASVLGSIAALIIAIFFGFSTVIAAAGIFYALAWLLIR